MRVYQIAIISCLVLGALCNQNTSDPEFISKFTVKHITPGDGSFPVKGSLVKVHYTGTFPNTGKKFDSSRDRDEPFTFMLGQGQVIKCWDEVVARMSRKERVTVVCPSSLAYGERGAGSTIPPNSDIAFDIEMLDFKNINDEL